MVVVGILRCGPPYGIVRLSIVYDEFVFGRTSCINTGHNVNCIELGKLSLIIPRKIRLCLLFEKKLVRRVVDDFCGTGDAILT